MEIRLARSMWTVFEPVHAVAYFAPIVRQRFEAAGVRGFWRAYFAGRAAPLGAQGAPVVQAAFFGFAPRMVERAIPSVWDLIGPGDAWSLRSAACAETLEECATGIDRDELAAAERSLRSVADRLDPAGRVFFAAHLSLDWPDEPLASIWHACTLLREHRGDGHVAAAVAHGLSPVELLVLTDRLALTPSDHALDNRGWTQQEWDDGAGLLADGGLLASDGSLTSRGRALREAVEEATDVAASAVWDGVADRDVELIHRVLLRLSRAIAERGWLTYPNAVGVPPPAGGSRGSRGPRQRL